mmetsp:Transcript_7868/g.19645  ORF Transcript_7868/g.19645 Transcript_7868/m.19645 type:complete len:227 (+) Transcript_7868:1001-1681(+)
MLILLQYYSSCHKVQCVMSSPQCKASTQLFQHPLPTPGSPALLMMNSPNPQLGPLAASIAQTYPRSDFSSQLAVQHVCLGLGNGKVQDHLDHDQHRIPQHQPPLDIEPLGRHLAAGLLEGVHDGPVLRGALQLRAHGEGSGQHRRRLCRLASRVVAVDEAHPAINKGGRRLLHCCPRILQSIVCALKLQPHSRPVAQHQIRATRTHFNCCTVAAGARAGHRPGRLS